MHFTFSFVYVNVFYFVINGIQSLYPDLKTNLKNTAHIEQCSINILVTVTSRLTRR